MITPKGVFGTVWRYFGLSQMGRGYWLPHDYRPGCSKHPISPRTASTTKTNQPTKQSGPKCEQCQGEQTLSWCSHDDINGALCHHRRTICVRKGDRQQLRGMRLVTCLTMSGTDWLFLRMKQKKERRRRKKERKEEKEKEKTNVRNLRCSPHQRGRVTPSDPQRATSVPS